MLSIMRSYSAVYHFSLCRLVDRAIEESRVSWNPIDDATPKDRVIEVYAPEREGFGPYISLCKWHPDAGFCIHEICEPTHWREHIPPRSYALWPG